MSGPSVQHGDLETHPAQVFGQVFAALGVAVQAYDQLIAVDTVGTCKLEEGGEAVREGNMLEDVLGGVITVREHDLPRLQILFHHLTVEEDEESA